MSKMSDDELLGGEDDDDISDVDENEEEYLLRDEEDFLKERKLYDKKDSDSDEPDDDVLNVNLQLEDDFLDEEKEDDQPEPSPGVTKEVTVSVEKLQNTNQNNIKTFVQPSKKPPQTINKNTTPNKKPNIVPQKVNRNNTNHPLVRNGQQQKRGIRRGNFQTRTNFVNNNASRRRNGKVLINPRFEGTVHVNDSARLKWDSQQIPQNNFVTPWTSGNNMLSNCDLNQQLTLLTTLAAQTRPDILLPQPQIQTSYEPPLSFEPPPNVEEPYNNQNQATNHQMLPPPPQPPYLRENHHQPYNNETDRARMQNDSKMYNSYSNYGNYGPTSSPQPRKTNVANSYDRYGGNSRPAYNSNSNYPPQNAIQNRNTTYGNDSYQNRNPNYGNNNYQNKNQNYGNVNYQNRNPNFGNDNYENKSPNYGHNNYQNTSPNYGSGNYQKKNSNYGSDSYQNRNPNFSEYNVHHQSDSNNRYNYANYESKNSNDVQSVYENVNKPDFKQNQPNTFNNEFQNNRPESIQNSKRLNNFDASKTTRYVPNKNFGNQQNRRPTVQDTFTFEVRNDLPEKKLKLNDEVSYKYNEQQANPSETQTKQANENQPRREPDEDGDEDEETRAYRLKIQQQKMEREKVLRMKEERRKQMILEQQKKDEAKLIIPPATGEQVQGFSNQNFQQNRVPQFTKKNNFEHSAGTVTFQKYNRSLTSTSFQKSNQPFSATISVQNENAPPRFAQRPNQYATSRLQKPIYSPERPRPISRQMKNSNLLSVPTNYSEPTVNVPNSDTDFPVEMPNLTFKVSNDLHSNAPTTKDFPKNKSSNTFMSNRVVVVKNKNTQRTGVLPSVPSSTLATKTIPIEGNSEGQGLSSFFNNRKVLKKDNDLLNTRLVVVNNLSTSVNHSKLESMCQGIGEIQKLRVDAQERQATILFKSVASAHAFFKKYQRRILDDLSVIEVKLQPML